jgi:putative hydrolase of the HAD superfamily
MESRRFDAVIFDLFGTLVYNRPWGDEMNRAVATAVGGEVNGFLREWAKTGQKRSMGAYPSVGENLQEVFRTLGVAITPEQVERAIAIRLDYTRRNLAPKEGAVKLLRRLRDMGLKTGLLSNCTPEIPVLWPELPLAPFFDDAVFSCDVGMAKPQREIFELACRRLATPPERCVYVADNNDCELDVAVSCGIYAVRLLPSEGEGVPQGAERWQGPAIKTLPQLLGHLDDQPTGK